MEGAFKKLNYISKQSYNICEHCLIRNGGGRLGKTLKETNVLKVRILPVLISKPVQIFLKINFLKVRLFPIYVSKHINYNHCFILLLFFMYIHFFLGGQFLNVLFIPLRGHCLYFLF